MIGGLGLVKSPREQALCARCSVPAPWRGNRCGHLLAIIQRLSCSGAAQYNWVGHNAQVYRVEFSSDGTKALSADSLGYMKYWDVATGHCLFCLSPPSPDPPFCCPSAPASALRPKPSSTHTACRKSVCGNTLARAHDSEHGLVSGPGISLLKKTEIASHSLAIQNWDHYLCSGPKGSERKNAVQSSSRPKIGTLSWTTAKLMYQAAVTHTTREYTARRLTEWRRQVTHTVPVFWECKHDVFDFWANRLNLSRSTKRSRPACRKPHPCRKKVCL